MTTRTSPHRRRRRREAGITPVITVMVLAALALVAAIFVTGALAVATQTRGDAQHGADAAALGGAQAVLDDIPDDVRPGFLTPYDIPELLGGGRCLKTGYSQAARLAAANGDELTSYCYDAFDDEISVEVRTDDGRSEAEATAATTFEAGRCRLDPGFTPSPSPTPDPDDDSDDAPPAPQQTVIDCGLEALTVVYDPVDSRFHFVGLELVLADVHPRLTK